MAQSVSLWGATYSNVPSIEVPKSGGGTASFTDVTDTTASAADVAQGKYFYLANGTKTEGTNQGGSGDGYVWQDGNGYVHLSDEEGTQPIYDTLTVSTSGTFTPAQGHAYNSVVVASGTAGTPSATKGTVSGHAVTVTPSVTNTTGWITGSTKTGTGVSVSASELVSGTYSVTSSGTKDVTNYASASVPAGTATAPATISGTSASVSTGTNTLTLSKTVSVTPSVTAGYVSSGTAGNSAVSLTASVNTRTSSDLTANTLTVTAPSGYYASSASKTLSDANLTAGNIKKDVSIFGVTGSYEGGGSATLITKNITANGTYNASSDNADGYSSVTVSVSGGASNFVQGTFTASTAGSVQEISIPYSGNGYILSLTIYVTNGIYNSSASDWWNVIHTYATGHLSITKSYVGMTPDYTQNNSNYNGGSFMVVYKNNTSNGNSYTRTSATPLVIYKNETPTSTNSGFIRITSKNTVKILVCGADNGTYGFLSGVNYTYHAVYSE